MHGEHHDSRPGALFLDLLRRLESVHVGHADVHEDDVGQFAPGVLDRLPPGTRFAHDLEVVGLREHRGDPLPNELVIVDEEHPNGHCARF